MAGTSPSRSTLKGSPTTILVSPTNSGTNTKKALFSSSTGNTTALASSSTFISTLRVRILLLSLCFTRPNLMFFSPAAEFLHEFSSFEGLFQKRDHRPIDKVQAAVHYIKSHYLPHLAHWGLHILYTVPIWHSGTLETLPSCSLTSIAYHIYSKTQITRHTWAHVAAEPAIVILGMIGFRSLPSTYLEYTADLVITASRGISYGTVSVSRSVFLDQRLLQLLTRINALTTVVPKFYGVHNGAWKLELTTWAQHEWRKDQACDWTAVTDEEGHLKYKWQHRDYWTYEHEGSGEVANGSYSVSCKCIPSYFPIILSLPFRRHTQLRPVPCRCKAQGS